MSSRKPRNDDDSSRKRESDGEIARIERLLRLMEDHGLSEIEIGPDGRSVRLSKLDRVGAGPMPAPAATTPAPVPASPVPHSGDRVLVPFLSPMVGTFYRASSPEASAYVKEGDVVKPGSALCMIEAMKVFNEIQCDIAGEIVEILVENGEAVEYGQPLFQIKRSG